MAPSSYVNRQKKKQILKQIKIVPKVLFSTKGEVQTFQIKIHFI